MLWPLPTIPSRSTASWSFRKIPSRKGNPCSTLRSPEVTGSPPQRRRAGATAEARKRNRALTVIRMANTYRPSGNPRRIRALRIARKNFVPLPAAPDGSALAGRLLIAMAQRWNSVLAFGSPKKA
jgi:hypothetical protein